MTKQEKINIVQVIVAIIITCVLMFIFIGQKQGWHEDEIFSYGSSNYKYDNLLQRYSYKDTLNQVMDELVTDDNILKTAVNFVYYYFFNSEEFDAVYQEKRQYEEPEWKTPEDVEEYLTVSSDEIFSYWSVYYNQSRDVHPPLFYFLVHLVSSLALGQFSKYIIFSINLIFYIGTCIFIRKIMKLFNKDYLSGITILLYGLSMGAISIVMFQRMYAMLIFFAMCYSYLTLKICKNNYEIDKKTKRWLTITIVLGFLTQYYFCIYVVFVAIVMMLVMLKQKNYASLKSYLWCHIKAAIIGIVLFPASIYHIFFTGRAGGSGESYISCIKQFLEFIFYAFSVPNILGYILTVIIAILFIIKLCKAKRKDIVAVIGIPVILYFLVIAKISPYIEIRYISLVFPIIAIAIVFMLISIVKQICKYFKKSKKIEKWAQIITVLTITIFVSVYGLICSEPKFLYKDYAQRLEIAEEYKELKLVYVGEAEFVYIKDIEEFLIYRSTIIVNTWDMDVLEDNEGLEGETEFILNIKTYVEDVDGTLEKVLEYTNATDYELLLR